LVVTPSRDQQAQQHLRIALDPKVGMALEVGLPPGDAQTTQRIEELMIAFPSDHALHQWARLTLGRQAACRFLRGDTTVSRQQALSFLADPDLPADLSAGLKQEARLWAAMVHQAAEQEEEAACAINDVLHCEEADHGWCQRAEQVVRTFKRRTDE
jgi:hypothetical protein